MAQFRFHNNGYSDLHDCLGRECLPDEYGGTDGPIDYEKSLKFVLAREKMLEQNRRYGVKSSETPWRLVAPNDGEGKDAEEKKGRGKISKKKNRFKYSHVQNNMLNKITQRAEYARYLNMYIEFV